MTTDEAKAELKSISRLERKIEFKRREVERIEALINRVTPTFREDIIQGGVKTSIDDRIDQLAEVRCELNKLLGELVLVRRTVSQKLVRIDDPLMAEILIQRYIECRKWEDVADSVCMTRGWAITVHRRALCEYRAIEL